MFRYKFSGALKVGVFPYFWIFVQKWHPPHHKGLTLMHQILTSFGVWFPYDVLLDSRYNFLQFLLEQNQQKLQISLCSINALLDISILLFDYAGRKALLTILSKFAQPLLQTCLKTLALRNEYALALLRAQLLLFGKGTEKFDLLNIISPAGPSILNQIAINWDGYVPVDL